MISNHNLGALMGAPVQGDDGDKIGNVGQIFVDPQNGNPNWVTVHTGLFGRHETFVPLGGATWDYEVLRVPFDKKTIKDAPRIDTDEALSPEHEADLYRYYRLGGEDERDRTDHDHDHDHDHDQHDTDQTGNTRMVEESAATGTTDAASAEQQGPLRLRKYVVTEDKEVTVPVQHEVTRVETEGDVHVDTSGAPDVQVTDGQVGEKQVAEKDVTEGQRGRHAADE